MSTDAMNFKRACLGLVFIIICGQVAALSVFDLDYDICPEEPCPQPPQCAEGEVALEQSAGNGQPGNCCTTYKCAAEPTCGPVPEIYWKSKCIKCNSCIPICTRECEDEEQPELNCLTFDQGQIKLHGDTWTEDHGCQNCSCVNGDRQCVGSVCDMPNCDNPVEREGECCKVCPDEDAQIEKHETWQSTSVAINATTESMESSVSSEAPEEDVTATSTGVYSTTESDQNATEHFEIPTEASKVEMTGDDATDKPEIPTADQATELPIYYSSELPKSSSEYGSIENATTESIEMSSELVTELPEVGTENGPNENATDRTEIPEIVVENATELNTAENVAGENAAVETPIEIDSSAMEVTEKDVSTEVNSSSARLEASTSTPLPSSTSNPDNPEPSTAEEPASIVLVSTSAPPPMTPESTSYHKDAAINEEDYRMANAETAHISEELSGFDVIWILGFLGFFGLLLLILVLIVWFNWRLKRNRKSNETLYSSVPNSDTNLSETSKNTVIAIFPSS